MKKKLPQFERIIVKRYSFLSIFHTIKCDLKISKEKELRFIQIKKEILKLNKEMENLFKKETKNENINTNRK